jgi:hypothetical protein
VKYTLVLHQVPWHWCHVTQIGVGAAAPGAIAHCQELLFRLPLKKKLSTTSELAVG